MAEITPSFVTLKQSISKNGMSGGSVHALLYNIYLALYAFCNNVDFDNGTIGSDFESKISTPLAATADANDTPPGALDSSAGAFYTPGNMSPEGLLQCDLYTALIDIAAALKLLCVDLDACAGAALATTFRANISTPLTTTLGSVLAAPPEGLITSTYFYGLESYIANGSFSQGDLYKCLYDFYIAIVRICTLFDAGAGTMPATLMANVGTPLTTAVGNFVEAPTG